MLANANSNTDAQLDPVSSDRNVREIIAVCAKHEIPCGTTENLAGFMRALYDNKHLAMDFWAVVARLTGSGGEAASPDGLLAIVVEGVTGQTIAEVRATGPADSALVGKLARILAGHDELPAPESKFPPQAVRDSSPPSPHEERPRLRLDPDLSSAEPALNAHLRAHNPQADPQIVIPLAAYADRERDGRGSLRLLAAALVLVLIAGGCWLAYHRNPAPWQSHWQKLSVGVHADIASAGSSWKKVFSHRPAANVQQISAPATSANPLAAPDQLPSLPQTPPPAAQSEPAQDKPAQAAQPVPANSPQSEAASGKPAQDATAAPAPTKHRKTIDPVVLQAARESQQN